MSTIYLENYMEDCVIRKTEDKCYIKRIKQDGDGNYVLIPEREISADSSLVTGSDGFGCMALPSTITKEEYDSFGVKWLWDWETGKKRGI